jgi:hypothetical protein
MESERKMNVEKFITLLNHSEFDDVPEQIKVVHSQVAGFSAPKIMNLLNLAVSCMISGEIYYEIGTHQGRTLIGALVENDDASATAVDNFSQFNDGHAEERLLANLSTFDLSNRVDFRNADYRDIVGLPPVGVFFYDGNHDSEVTLDALERTTKFLAPRALILLDDISGAPSCGPGCWGGVLPFLVNHLTECAPVFLMGTNNFPFGDKNWWNGIVALQWHGR